MSLIGLSVQSAGHALGAERALGRGAVGIVSQREEDEKLEVKKGNVGGGGVAPSREMGNSCRAGWRREDYRAPEAFTG